ncbi:MAG: hypothetical protein J2P57_08560 [Acidimicrobiaceae bacterium]|nr:hypothetical protein [Acidimicrobiaceae bacterium]
MGQWEGGSTHTGDVVFDDLPIGSVQAASGKTVRLIDPCEPTMLLSAPGNLE